MAVSLSLLTAYRGRREYLDIQLAWLQRIREEEAFTDFEVVLVEGDLAPTVSHLPNERGLDWVRYVFVPMGHVFHKAGLLNEAILHARGAWIMPFDVDLLPAPQVLARHLQLAQNASLTLMCGYRVQLPEMFPTDLSLPAAQTVLHAFNSRDPDLLCPEDNHTALAKYLVGGERFGVCPCFETRRLKAVGGHDEVYAGWGAEDQDLIERVCASGRTLVRAYDLLYFHLPHGKEPGWGDAALTEANRKHFKASRSRARNPQKTVLSH